MVNATHARMVIIQKLIINAFIVQLDALHAKMKVIALAVKQDIF